MARTGPYHPSFSPDREWIGFYQGGGIRRRSMATGDVETVIAEGVNPRRGFAWSSAGEIFVIDDDDRILRIPQAGGDPVEVDVGTLEEGRRISNPSPLRVAASCCSAFWSRDWTISARSGPWTW